MVVDDRLHHRIVREQLGNDVAGLVEPLEELALVVYQREHGCMAALAGRMPHALGEIRMKELLAGGVLLDGEALRSLDELGLAHLTGVALGQSYDSDTQEIFSNDPLNRHYGGWKRDCRQSFRWWNVTAC